MPKKYDDEHIIALAREHVRFATSANELAEAVGIPTSSLKDILRRSGYPKWEALLTEQGDEALGNVQMLKRQANYLKKVVARQERDLTDRLWLKQEVAGQMAVLDPVEVNPPEYNDGDHQAQVALLEVSDFHYGLSITSGQLGPLFAGYNEEVGRARFDHIFRAFARLSHQQSFPVKRAVVYVLGDLIEHSNMRPAQAKYTSSHVVKQTIDMASLLASNVRMLCGEFEEVEVHCIPGNHGRATAKAGDNLPDETFEHLLYYIAQTALSAQPNLEFVTYPAWYFIHNILGFKFLGLHGEDCHSWAGVPFYGIERMIKDYYMLGGMATRETLRRLPINETMTAADFLDMLQFPDYACLGHFHTPMLWDMLGVEILANGAGCGASFYSAKRLHRYTPPRQNMMFVHPNWGVGLRLKIDLAHIGPE